MLFFDNVELVCPVCNGKRFKDKVLEVTLFDHSISQILDMSITEASTLFKVNKKLTKIFDLLLDVGLGYVTLGQSLTTLSGGEGQRMKLAKELLTAKKGKQLFLIDEPTTGLHPVDIEHFLVLLQRIVDAGNTVIVVEHNEQVIRSADWIVELGPEGGEK
ncbi:ATP-binding cassette domain-containing protein [Paenisporosarcina antarctica]|uniref:UvrABC system protein A n=1 Tax=Paenisporosarcina antarctica TaxID=417367 RepID=A0A4P6ZX61_9BACL|nr:ATP-binding cassette domain-containing protein [Paenisporosarcina antarctica]QBP40977.1 ATP-binding cassette domain-containing protein [Paenisporosarcina antarctica]